jgi:glucose-6-phosphate 1-dehydrogenase
MQDLVATNPFRNSSRAERVPEPCTLVIFGASGDLTKRKLVPAVFEIARQNLLPPEFAILGVARTQMDDNAFRNYLHEAMKEFGQLGDSESVLWENFARRCFYLTLDPASESEFPRLKERLAQLDSNAESNGSTLFYLSTPPSLYKPLVTRLGASGLNKGRTPDAWVRIIIEKPFGYDLASARALNNDVLKVFAEDQVYRIDHYLAGSSSEPVGVPVCQRYFRGNLERELSTMYRSGCETVGVENQRILRSAGAMGYDSESYANSRLTARSHRFSLMRVRCAMRAGIWGMRVMKPESETLCGQYTLGVVGGKTVPGYRTEKGVSPTMRQHTLR